ncbi:MAG: HDOD domain-containing protein [Gammaproteobacteria bacterium]
MTDCSNKAFAFVQGLATDLKGGDIELPAFPDVVKRLQIILVDPNASAHDVVEVISVEPILTARLMRMANSAALNPKGIEITSLGAAVSRLGFNIVRSTATAYAMAQMQQQQELRPIRKQLSGIWKSSNNVAAICYIISKHVLKHRPDEALLAGLLHQMGRLYILIHAQQNDPGLLHDDDYLSVVQNWQAQIGRTILESWALPEPICVAVGAQDTLLDESAEGGSESQLALLLSGATLRHRLSSDPTLREVHPNADELVESLELEGNNFLEAIVTHYDDIETMQHTLSA